MALLYDPAMRAIDGDGVPYPHAYAYIYSNSALTTPAAVYTDSTLNTALANPVPADSDGYFPQMFAAEGDTYYIDVRTDTNANSGVRIKTYSAVVALGEATGTIRRVFDNSELNIRGDDIGDGTQGIVIEAGTDGGAGAALGLSAKNGDPLDKFRLTALESTVTGDMDVEGTLNATGVHDLQEGGMPVSGVILSASPTSFSAASTVSIALTNTPAGTRGWRIRLFDLVFSSAVANINMRLAYDGVPTYKSGATDYAGATIAQAAGSASITQSSGAAQIGVYGTSSSSTSHPLILDFEVMTPNSDVGDTNVWGKMLGYTASGTAAPTGLSFDFIGKGDYGRATHIGLIPSTGTVSGKYRIEALRGFGE